MPIKAVLFDLDGTLTNRPASMVRFCYPFLRQYAANLGELTAETLFAVIEKADGGGYRNRGEMFEELVQELPWLQPPTADEVGAFWWSTFPGCAEATSGIPALLDSLRSLGLVMGIVTNGNIAGQNAKIDALALRPYMKAVLTSEEAGVEKPNPAIFHRALSLLGVEASEALFVGDDPLRDIEGARNAGLEAVWFRASRTWPEDLPPPSHAIDSLLDVLSFI
jgi:putative hydrolase of the HAD superfamily